jgi:hypothetical protein
MSTFTRLELLIHVLARRTFAGLPAAFVRRAHAVHTPWARCSVRFGVVEGTFS